VPRRAPSGTMAVAAARLAPGERRVQLQSSWRTTGGRRTGGRRAQLPRHGCGVPGTRRIASNANRRADTRRRAKKILDACVPVTQAITHKLSPNVRNPCGFHLEVLQDMRFPFGNFKSLIINKMPDFTKCLYVTYELVVDYGNST